MSYTLDLAGAGLSYKSMMETYNEAVFGMLEPLELRAEPKTLEMVAKAILPYVCSEKALRVRIPYRSGNIEHDRTTILVAFHAAGLCPDPTLPKGTILFHVPADPEKDSRIINAHVD